MNYREKLRTQPDFRLKASYFQESHNAPNLQPYEHLSLLYHYHRRRLTKKGNRMMSKGGKKGGKALSKAATMTR
jgi:hypothetical protein